MIDVLGPEKRRRRSVQEKIAIVQQSFEPGMTLSVNRKYRHRSGRIQGKWPLEKVTSGGAPTASSSAVITVKNCGSRSRWTVAFARHFTGRQVPVDMTVKPCRTSCWVQ